MIITCQFCINPINLLHRLSIPQMASEAQTIRVKERIDGAVARAYTAG